MSGAIIGFIIGLVLTAPLLATLGWHLKETYIRKTGYRGIDVRHDG